MATFNRRIVRMLITIVLRSQALDRQVMLLYSTSSDRVPGSHPPQKEWSLGAHRYQVLVESREARNMTWKSRLVGDLEAAILSCQLIGEMGRVSEDLANLEETRKVSCPF